MVYQISEKNQILLVLFIIVVLCAGKLFKDYLFRRGYIEGLTVIPETNKILRRPAANGENLTGVTITLNLTLGANLGANNTITVRWLTGKGVTMSADPSHYTVSGMTTSVSGSTLTITNGANQVTSGTKVTIVMSNVTIVKENASPTPPFNNDFAFTTTTHERG